MNESRVGAALVDLFCGAGGLSHGFRLEGFPIAAGIDIDEHCRYPFERNNGAPFMRHDVAALTAANTAELFVPGRRSILIGCAPCQPFSLYNQRNDNPKWRLLEVFGGLIASVRPDIVSMENVPRLIDFRDGAVFHHFVRLLRKCGYDVSHQIVNAADYGVPQQRHRLVLLASRLGPIALEPSQRRPENYRTVAEAIGHLPPLEAGEVDTNDPLHRASRLSERNKRRVVASRPGGTWRDWNDALVTPCHRADTGRGYASVYGRMLWDEPSPTITTQYYGFGSGRFGHPEQDRAISLREGAILQSFPDDYAFVSPGDTVQFKALGRMVGNAVPVHLARAIARSIRRHLEDHA